MNRGSGEFLWTNPHVLYFQANLHPEIERWATDFVNGNATVSGLEILLVKKVLFNGANGDNTETTIAALLRGIAAKGNSHRHKILDLFANQFQPSAEYSMNRVVMNRAIDSWIMGDSSVLMANETLETFIGGACVWDTHIDDETWCVLQRWHPNFHQTMPIIVKQQIKTVLMIHRHRPDSGFARLPKDILYMIFGWIAVAHSDIIRTWYDDDYQEKNRDDPFLNADYHELGPFPTPIKKETN